jgi:hypothetical protein
MHTRRNRLWAWYAPGAALLAYLIITYAPASQLANSEAPMFIGTWANIREEGFFVAIVSLGLLCGELRGRGRAIAFVVAAYSLAVAMLAMLASWPEFVNHVAENGAQPISLGHTTQAFLDRHDPLDPFSLGFWTVLTPPAMIALLALHWFFRKHLRETTNAQALARVVLFALAGSSAFVLGVMLAQGVAPGVSLVSGTEIGFVPLPVIALGALTTWTICASVRPKKPPSTPAPAGAATAYKVLASASQISVAALVLLYLAITQAWAYTEHIARIVHARQALAQDVVQQYSAMPNAFGATFERNGIRVAEAPLLVVFWGTISIERRASDVNGYFVEVKDALSRENWSMVRTPYRTATEDSARETKRVAPYRGNQIRCE